jgi:hypothetical protein
MFASGVVKLTSQCPTWWSLTALNYHYETQCIPMPLAWYFHHLPSWFQRFSVVATYVIEISVPFLFFLPIRNVRLFAFCCQVLLQVLIILTGNYNFFNLLTMALCLSLVDDNFFGRATRDSNRVTPSCFVFLSKLSSFLRPLLHPYCSAVVYALMFAYTTKFFGLRLSFPSEASFLPIVESSVQFSQPQFFSALKDVMPYTVCMGVVSLSVEIIKALSSSLRTPSCTKTGMGVVERLRSETLRLLSFLQVRNGKL